MIIGGLAAAVVVLTGGYDRLRDYVELWTGDRFLPETTNGQVFGSSPSSGTEDMEPGLPELVRERNSQVIRHTGYTVSYNAETKIPNWVAWTLTPERFEETVSRYDKFLPDPEVANPVTTEDYKRSGYDRGHLGRSLSRLDDGKREAVCGGWACSLPWTASAYRPKPGYGARGFL